ncbi:hypothetical protein C3L33_09073, partial [Rhododendron williamsianum]
MAGCGSILATLVHPFRMFILLNDKVPVNLSVTLLEEYERTGMHDAALLSDPGNPLPEDVLKTLLHRLEFENKLMELCNESKNDLSCTPFENDARDAELMRPSPNEEKKVELGLCDTKNEGSGALKRLIVGNETVMMSPQGLPCKDDNVNIPGNGKALCPKLLLEDDIQTSRTNGSSDGSSRVMVIKQVNAVTDLQDFVLNFDHCRVMEKEALRLLSWLASSQAAEDINSDDELAPEAILTPLKRRVRKASLDEEQHYPKPLDHTIRNYGQDEMPREFANSELSLRTEITRAHDVRHSYHVDDVTAQACGGSSEITTSFRSNPSEFFNSANQKSGISVACCENDSMGDSECIDFKEHITSEACVGQPDLCVQMQIFDNDDKLCDNVRLKLGDSTGTSYLSSASFQREILGVDDCVYKNAQDGKTLIPKLSKTPSTNVGVMEPTSDSTILQFENRGRGQHGKATDLSVPISSVSSTIDFGTNPMELIGMTFHRNPPMVDLNNIQRISLEGGGSYGGISVLYILGLLFKIENVISAEDCPRSCFPLAVFVTCDFMKAPLFVDEEPVTEPSFGFVGKLKVKKVEELLAYQNFTLEDSVSRWLLHVDSGQNSNAAAMEPSSPTGSSSSQIDSQGSWVESCGKRVTEPGSVSLKSPILGKLKQQICGDLNVEMNPFVKFLARWEIKANSYFELSMGCNSGFHVQAESRGELRPDPRFDAINVVVLAFQEDNDSKINVFVLLRSNTEQDQRFYFFLPLFFWLVLTSNLSPCVKNLVVLMLYWKVFASSEEKLFSHFMNIIRSIDPDILMGWDIQGSSLGYLAERAMHLGISLLNGISRTQTETKVADRLSGVSDTGILDYLLPEHLVSDSIQLGDLIIDDKWGRTHASGVHVGGRVVLNIWRLMRGELKLNMYTVEAVAEAVLRRRVPYIQCKVWKMVFKRSRASKARLKFSSSVAVFWILHLISLHENTWEMEVASQPAMECLPLVMEPESGFYADPVVVLDFQSLYPSMIIAYNLCFCTCLGNFRKGILPRLLEEILSTRIMVKQAMKKLAPSQQVLHRASSCVIRDTVKDANSKSFQSGGWGYTIQEVELFALSGDLRCLHYDVQSTNSMLDRKNLEWLELGKVKQLALKLIVNVTYGYTAARFSGRVPCAELADSIVQCGRRTLENAISFVNSHDRWNAKVYLRRQRQKRVLWCSMFVLLRGRTVEESFEIGHEIASAVTAANPNPVTLKMEKVYHS